MDWNGLDGPIGWIGGMGWDGLDGMDWTGLDCRVSGKRIACSTGPEVELLRK